MRICLLGMQASGKGTLAQEVQEILNIPVISVGAIYRDEISKCSKIGRKVQSYVKKGVNAPSKITNKMVLKRLKQLDCKSGFIIDGYPRNMEQAKFIDKKLPFDIVFELQVDEGLIIDRLSGRLTCEKCATVFNTKNYKKKTCSKCGGKLLKRADDNIDAIKNRIETTKTETYPVIEHYKKQGKLEILDGNKKPAEVKEQFLKVLGKVK